MSAAAEATPKKRRNAWIWVSALLAVVAVGLLVWALTAKSDLDSTKDELASVQKELDTAQQSLDTTTTELNSTTQELDAAQQDVEELQAAESEDGERTGRVLLTAGTFAVMKSVYDDLADQLGATQEDLDATQKQLEEANQKADQAEDDAAAAETQAAQAGTEAEKAEAEKAQAEAEVEAAQSKTAVVTECARAYVSAFGTLFEGDSIRAQAGSVREEFAGITTECKAAMAAGSS
jgi:septal ring factor EnvC (AmiA/AmiB activator)